MIYYDNINIKVINIKVFSNKIGPGRSYFVALFWTSNQISPRLCPGDSSLQVSSQKALWTRTHKVWLPPFPQSPNTIPVGLAPSNGPHILTQCFQGIQSTHKN